MPWGNDDTQTLIDILAEYDVPATFFVVGAWVDKYPESVKALSDAGHQIQNHSNTHPHMPQLSREQMKDEIESCNKKIEAITGVCPTLLRPPYGDYDNALIETMDSLGMKTIQWDVDVSATVGNPHRQRVLRYKNNGFMAKTTSLTDLNVSNQSFYVLIQYTTLKGDYIIIRQLLNIRFIIINLFQTSPLYKPYPLHPIIQHYFY